MGSRPAPEQPGRGVISPDSAEAPSSSEPTATAPTSERAGAAWDRPSGSEGLPSQAQGQATLIPWEQGGFRLVPSEAAEPVELEPEHHQVRAAGQLSLPLPLEPYHVPRDGKAPCQRGVRILGYCPHDPPRDWAELVRAETCALQRCESSKDANGRERARDAFDGTAKDRAARIGLRDFGSVPWAVFIFTVPFQLRALCVGAKLREAARAADELAVEVLQARAKAPESLWYVQSWTHPVGEPVEGKEGPYHPHFNVLIPLACLRRSRNTDRAKRVLVHQLPREWLGSAGWVGAAWRARLAEIFGSWWKGAPPAVNWFYEWKTSVEEKKHALRYFPRPFPTWADHPLVPLRPRSSGLKHWKREGALRTLLGQLRERPLPRWSACPACVARNEDVEPLSGAGPDILSAAMAIDRARELHLQACDRADCPQRGAAPLVSYVQDRRIILSGGAGETGPPPHETGPPPPGWTAGDDLAHRIARREVARRRSPALAPISASERAELVAHVGSTADPATVRRLRLYRLLGVLPRTGAGLSEET